MCAGCQVHRRCGCTARRRRPHPTGSGRSVAASTEIPSGLPSTSTRSVRQAGGAAGRDGFGDRPRLDLGDRDRAAPWFRRIAGRPWCAAQCRRRSTTSCRAAAVGTSMRAATGVVGSGYVECGRDPVDRDADAGDRAVLLIDRLRQHQLRRRHGRIERNVQRRADHVGERRRPRRRRVAVDRRARRSNPGPRSAGGSTSP